MDGWRQPARDCRRRDHPCWSRSSTATATAARSMAISGPGQRGRNTMRGQEQCQQGRGNNQRRQMNLVQMGNEEPQLGDDRIPLHRDAGHLAELADDHQDRDAGHVSDQHRMGQQVGQKAQPRHPADARRSRRPPALAPRRCWRTGLLITGDQRDDGRGSHQARCSTRDRRRAGGTYRGAA